MVGRGEQVRHGVGACANTTAEPGIYFYTRIHKLTDHCCTGLLKSVSRVSSWSGPAGRMNSCFGRSPFFETEAEWEVYAALPPAERIVHTGALSKMMGIHRSDLTNAPQSVEDGWHVG